jgi:adenylate kinase family enzyme
MADIASKSIIFVLGGPGSGKGTQTQSIANDYGIGYLSTGDLLRAATSDEFLNGNEDASAVERGEKLKEIMKNGELVPDEVILELVKVELEKSDKAYFFVDGFPRAVSQAEAFEAQIAAPAAVLFLDVPDTELTARLLKRGETSGRSDDNQEAIVKRLATYHDQSYPVVERYTPQGKVIKLNGFRPIDAVRAEILFQLRKIWDIPVKEGEPERQPEPEGELAQAGEAAQAAVDQAKEGAKDAKEAASKCCLLL